jgi:hypothetical protein
MTSQLEDENPLPQSLVVAVEESQVAAVVAWWNGLTETQRHELLDDATNQPDNIANQTDIGCSSDHDEPNEWYEYVVNQDMRFYFDRHNGCQTSHGFIVYPMLSAISAAADANIVSHVLKRNGG